MEAMVKLLCKQN